MAGTRVWKVLQDSKKKKKIKLTGSRELLKGFKLEKNEMLRSAFASYLWDQCEGKTGEKTQNRNSIKILKMVHIKKKSLKKMGKAPPIKMSPKQVKG